VLAKAEDVAWNGVVTMVVELVELDVLVVVDVLAALLLEVKLEAVVLVAVSRAELLYGTTRIVIGDTSTPCAYRIRRYVPATAGAVAE